MINILVYALTDRLGGIENFFINYYHEFTNIRMDFISICPEIQYWEKLKKNDNELYYVPRRKAGKKKRKKAFEQILKSRKYDIFWYNANDLADLGILQIVKQNNIDVVICHAHNSAADRWYRTILHLINRRKIGKYATLFFSCSEKASKWFFKNKGDIKVIYNAVDIEKFKYNPEIRKKLREELGIDDESMVVGNVGRLCKQKNQSYLIKIISSLLAKRQNVKLLILGDGELKSELERQIFHYNLQDKIVLLGQVKNVSDYLSVFDIMLMPSFYEGLPVTLVEAQASGLICLVSDTITKEVAMSGDIIYLPISEKSIPDWVNNIRKSSYREERSQELQSSMFDIATSASGLETMLLEEVNCSNAVITN